MGSCSETADDSGRGIQKPGLVLTQHRGAQKILSRTNGFPDSMFIRRAHSKSIYDTPRVQLWQGRILLPTWPMARSLRLEIFSVCNVAPNAYNHHKRIYKPRLSSLAILFLWASACCIAFDYVLSFMRFLVFDVMQGQDGISFTFAWPSTDGW